MRNALYSPFVSRLNPKRRWLVWATYLIWWVRWAESGGFDTVRVETTFLWMSETERVDGVHFFSFFHCLTDPNRLADEYKKTFEVGFGLWKFGIVVSAFQPYWSAKSLMALLTFRLTEQGTLLVLTRLSKEYTLHRHIPVPAIFLLLM